MKEYFTNEEVIELLKKIKSGDNEAWESLYHNFENYVHNRAWNRLRKSGIPKEQQKDLEEDLYQAGWKGFISSIQSYDPKKGEFLTYATHFIDGEMSKEINYALNSMGLTEKANSQMAKVSYAFEAGMSVPEAPDLGKYSAERRVLQIMEVLRILTDEEHSLSKDKLRQMLGLYRTKKHKNGTPPESSNTVTRTIEEMLMEVDSLEYTGENDRDYKIKYEGYKENRLNAKRKKEKGNKKKGKKAADITGFSYVHTFDRAELDRLIQLVCFSDMLSSEEKQHLVDKLVSTASAYYTTPFQDGKKLKFNPKAIHGRFSGRII